MARKVGIVVEKLGGRALLFENGILQLEFGNNRALQIQIKTRRTLYSSLELKKISFKLQAR